MLQNPFYYNEDKAMATAKEVKAKTEGALRGRWSIEIFALACALSFVLGVVVGKLF